MPRLFLVAALLCAIFLSGCRSAQQGTAPSVADVGDTAEDWCCAARQRCEDWLEQHPAVKSAAYVTAYAVLVTVVVVGVAVVVILYLRGQDDL